MTHDIDLKKKVAKFIFDNGQIADNNMVYFYYEPNETYWIVWCKKILMSSKIKPCTYPFSMQGFSQQENYNQLEIENFINSYDR